MSFEWDFGDDNITTTTTPTIIHVYAAAGSYTVALTVIDSEALSDSKVELITVEQAIPVASFIYSPDPAVKGGAVTFNASESLSVISRSIARISVNVRSYRSLQSWRFVATSTSSARSRNPPARVLICPVSTAVARKSKAE